MTLSRTAAATTRHAKRKSEALELRARGDSFEQIGRSLKISRSQAWKLTDEALRELNEEATEHAATLRALENQRLDTLLSAVWPDALAGKVGACRTVLQIAERRARLLGLDLASSGVNIGMMFDPENPPTVRIVPDSGPLLPRGVDGDDVDCQ